MRRLTPLFFAVLAVGQILSGTFGWAAEEYHAPALSIDERVNGLLGRMTLDEKVAQLSGISPKDLLKDGQLSLEFCRQKIPHGIGHLSQYSSGTTLKPRELAHFVRQLQEFLCTETRLGIPVICHEEAITGFAARGATTFPQQIGMAGTWDAELIRGNTAAIARTMRLGGATQALSPMLDLVDDARWGRGEEGFGEDPYLISLLGGAFIEGLQGRDLRRGVAATAKHFAGSRTQEETLVVFRNDTLMPFEVAVRQKHVASVMARYGSFRGVPSVASSYLLTDILRTEWGYSGAVVSDYGAIVESYAALDNFSPTGPKYFADAIAAAKGCLAAGLDVDLADGRTFAAIPQALKQGVIPVENVDRALRRHLTLKFQLGLLDPQPVFPGEGTVDFDPPEHQQRALQSARESLVLLKNDGLLPLRSDTRSIAVVGPNADSYYSLLGDYTYQMLSEYFHRQPIDPSAPQLITLLSGLRDRLGANVQIGFERGCDWTSPLEQINSDPTGDPRLKDPKNRYPLERIPPTSPERALALAAASDVVIAAMGETRYLSGENRNRNDVRLPGEQEEFVRRLIRTGKPVVLVVFGGRAMVLTDIAAGCRAIVYAWYPGQAGGRALAEMLMGDYSPSGKLTTTLPRNNAQVPISHRRGYRADDLPLFPFGHGLSYTTYSYAGLQVPAAVKTSAATILVRFELKNEGRREGVEVAQLYFAAKNKTTAHAAMELKGFARVRIPPGATKEILVEVSPQQFAMHDETGRLMIQPGTYDVLVGASATDIRLRATISLTGEAVNLARREQFFSQTTIR